jgi:hypothetical protein
MATSGTVGLTRFSTRKVIDNAYGVCKIVRQEITPERIEVANDWLFLRLSAMANRGIPLWLIQKTILPLYVARQSVPLPVGVTDIMEINLRRINRLSGTGSSSAGTADNAFDGDFATECITLANGWIQLQLTDGATRVPMFGILPGASGTWSYTMQGSNDGVAFTTFYTATAQVVVDGEWFWFDVEGMEEWSYYRLQATGGTILNVEELVLANTPSETNMAELNLDNYASLPDKTSLGQPTSYWLNKQRTQQIVTMWPGPGEISRFWNLVAYLQYQVQDVGTMAQEIQFRQSAYRALVLNLGFDLSLVDKEAKPDPNLPIEAASAWSDMWDGESDTSSTMLTPNIGVYTR